MMFTSHAVALIHPLPEGGQNFEGAVGIVGVPRDDELARIWGAGDKLDHLEAAYLRLMLL
jgi:hypothetical protein